MKNRSGERAAGVLQGGSDLQPQVPLQPSRAEGKGSYAASVGGEIPQPRCRPNLPLKQVHRCVGDGRVVEVHSFDLSGTTTLVGFAPRWSEAARAHLSPHGRPFSVDRVCVQEGQRSGRVRDADFRLLRESHSCGKKQL